MRRRAHLPPPDQLHEEVAAVALVQQLADEVEVGHQRALQDDGHVAGVEELDGVVLLCAAPLLAPHRQVHAEALRARVRTLSAGFSACTWHPTHYQSNRRESELAA